VHLLLQFFLSVLSPVLSLLVQRLKHSALRRVSRLIELQHVPRIEMPKMCVTGRDHKNFWEIPSSKSS